MLLIECNRAQHMGILKITWNCRFNLYLKCRKTSAFFAVYCCIFITQNSQTLQLKISIWKTYKKTDNRRTCEIFAQCNSAWGSCPGILFLKQTTACSWRYFPSMKFVLLEVLEHSIESVNVVVEDKWVKAI